MIGWLAFLTVAVLVIALILGCFDKTVMAVVATVLGIITFVLSLAIPSEEEKYIDSFEAGYYQMDMEKVIEEYDDTLKDIAVALKKENMNVVKIDKIGDAGFEFKIVSPNEDKSFILNDGLMVKEIVEAGWLIYVAEDNIGQTETTTEEVETIEAGYYYVADKLSIARDYDKEASLLMFKLAEMKQTHVRITVNNGQAVASILDDDIIYLLKYDDVLEMIEEESLILDNDLKYMSVNEAA